MIHSSGSAITSRPELSLTTGIFWVAVFFVSALDGTFLFLVVSVLASMLSPSLSSLSILFSALSFWASFLAAFWALLSSIFTAAKPISSPIVPLDTPSSLLFLINITLAPTFKISSSWVRTVFLRVSTNFLSPTANDSKQSISLSSAASSLSLMLLTLRLWV